MRMIKKCPKCDLNYILDGGEICISCRPIKKEIKLPKPRAEGNIAFKCNYCDGGKNDEQIGYVGVCSKQNIKENIEIKNRSWCSNVDCGCKKFLDGKLPYEQIVRPCYESAMFTDWKAEAGTNTKDGERKGKCRKLQKNVKNGLCILTTVLPNTVEEERIILGVFIVNVFEEGDEDCAEGFVQCTSKYKIKLSLAESKKMLFWNYYFNPNSPTKAHIGTGLFRYIDDYQSAQILRDIVEIKKDTPDSTLAKELLEEYCRIKSLDITQVPQKNGTLLRKE